MTPDDISTQLTKDEASEMFKELRDALMADTNSAIVGLLESHLEPERRKVGELQKLNGQLAEKTETHSKRLANLELMAGINKQEVIELRHLIVSEIAGISKKLENYQELFEIMSDRTQEFTVDFRRYQERIENKQDSEARIRTDIYTRLNGIDRTTGALANTVSSIESKLNQELAGLRSAIAQEQDYYQDVIGVLQGLRSVQGMTGRFFSSRWGKGASVIFAASIAERMGMVQQGEEIIQFIKALLGI